LIFLNLSAIPATEINWTIQSRQAGPLKIGMSIAEVRRLLKDETAFLIYWEDPAPDNFECAYLESAQKPKNLGLMFQHGYLVRVDVRDRSFRTDRGAAVGDSEDKTMALYQDTIRVQPHDSISKSGRYLIYEPADKEDQGYGIVFEAYSGVVTSFRVGTEAAIALSDGCK
jgi:hypothetical protein